MKIIIVTGPSGIGKNRLIRELATLGVYPLIIIKPVFFILAFLPNFLLLPDILLQNLE